MPRLRKATTRVIVRPTATRRGAQSPRGRPISVRTIGVTITRPERSPIHQVPQTVKALADATTPAAASASDATLAPTMLRDRAGGDEHGDVARLGQRQRLAREAPRQRGGEARLQARREGERQRHGDGGCSVQAARGIVEQQVGGERAEEDPGQHPRPEDEDARQGDTGRRIERRSAGRRDRDRHRRRGDRADTPAPSATSGMPHAVQVTPVRARRRGGGGGGGTRHGRPAARQI